MNPMRHFFPFFLLVCAVTRVNAQANSLTVGGGFFQVLSKEPFGPDGNGLLTEKLEASFQCRLYDVAGQPLGTLAGTAVLAVAHP